MKHPTNYFLKQIAGMLFAILLCSSCTKTTPANAKFLGNYTGTNSCSGAPTDIYIIAGVSDSKIMFSLSNSGYIYGNVSGNGFSIPNQTVTSGPVSFTVIGSGTLSGNSLTLEYSMLTTTCEFIGNK